MSRVKVELLLDYNNPGTTMVRTEKTYSDRHSDPPSLRIQHFTIKKRLVPNNLIKFEENKSLKAK